MPSRRHAGGRGVIRLQTPVGGIEGQEFVVTEIGLDLQQRAEPARRGIGKDRRDRRLESSLVAHAEN